MNRERLLFVGLLPALMVIIFFQLVPDASRFTYLRSLRYGDAATYALAQRADSLRTERFRALSSFKRAELRERADAALARSRGRLHIEATAGVTAKDVETLRNDLREELAALGVATPRHPITILVMKDTTFRFPRYERGVVLPRDPVAPCTIVIRIPQHFSYIGTRGTDRVLGTCAFHAQYGTPGAGMQAWLIESGLRLASYRTAPPSQVFAEGGHLGPNAANIALSYSGVAGCRAGRAESCAQLFRWQGQTQTYYWWEEIARMSPVAAEPGVVLAAPSMFSGASAVATHGLLAAIADSMSAEQFTRVWTGADRPEAAFEAATGEPLAAWMTRSLTDLIPAFRAGPSLAPWQWVIAVTMIGLFFGLVMRRAQRETT